MAMNRRSFVQRLAMALGAAPAPANADSPAVAKAGYIRPGMFLNTTMREVETADESNIRAVNLSPGASRKR